MNLKAWWQEFKLKAAAFVLQRDLPFVIRQQSGRPIFTDWSTENAIKNGLQASAWVYACIRKLAGAVSAVPWMAQQRTGEDEWEDDPQHPLTSLLAQPNPYMNRQDLIERSIYHLYLGGNALWHLALVQGVPVEAWPLLPDRIKPVPDRVKFLAGYEYRLGSEKITLKPEEVCHLQFVNPADPYWGLAPLRAASQTVDTDVEAVRWNKVSLQNRAVTDGLLSFSQVMSRDQFDEARKMVDEQHAGANNAHQLFVLGAGADFKEMGRSPVEMDFLRTRQFNVAEICAVFGVPVVLVSQERTTYNNLSTGRRIFWQDTIAPLCDDIAQALDLRFSAYWNPEGLRDPTKKTLRVAYDLSNMPAMQEVWQETVKSARQVWEMGVPFNVISQRMGLGFDPVAGGDTPWGGRWPTTAGGAPATRATKTQLQIKALPEDEKARLYRAFDADRTQWEGKLTKHVAALLTADAETVAEAFEDGGKAAASAAIEQRQSYWSSYLSGAYKLMIERFGTLEGRRLLRTVPKAAPVDLEQKVRSWQFSLEDPAVDAFVRSTIAQKITYMTQTTKDAIAGEIAAGLAANEGSGDIAKRIRQIYANWAGKGDSPIDHSRSYLIARTEAGTAVNYGHYAGAVQVAEETGAEIRKEWITSRDARVRDTHAAIDGEIVPLAERFSNGLLHSNDPAGPASEVCHCRCVTANIVEVD